MPWGSRVEAQPQLVPSVQRQLGRPDVSWQHSTSYVARSTLTLLLLRALVLRAWWQLIRGCIHSVLFAVPEHAPMRPTSGERHDELRVGVDSFGGLRLRWIKPSFSVRGCVRQAWNERIDQNIGMDRRSHLSCKRL